MRSPAHDCLSLQNGIDSQDGLGCDVCQTSALASEQAITGAGKYLID